MLTARDKPNLKLFQVKHPASVAGFLPRVKSKGVVFGARSAFFPSPLFFVAFVWSMAGDRAMVFQPACHLSINPAAEDLAQR